MAREIKYRSGYKYQLAEDYTVRISIKPAADINTTFVKLSSGGTLTILGGYAWDGPSGPVIDTSRNMRASLVHDALYQLIRNRKLTRKAHKNPADRLFQKICVEDGVPRPIALAYYHGLRLGGNPAVDPKNAREVHTAP